MMTVALRSVISSIFLVAGLFFAWMQALLAMGRMDDSKVAFSLLRRIQMMAIFVGAAVLFLGIAGYLDPVNGRHAVGVTLLVAATVAVPSLFFGYSYEAEVRWIPGLVDLALVYGAGFWLCFTATR